MGCGERFKLTRRGEGVNNCTDSQKIDNRIELKMHFLVGGMKKRWYSC